MQNTTAAAELTLKGEVTVNQITVWAGEIEPLLSRGCDVSLSLSGVTGMDLAGVQLLWALRRALLSAGHSLSVPDPVPDTVRQSFEQAGLNIFGDAVL